MFTIAHLADLHLGYSSGRKKIDENGYNVRENDGYIAYNEVIDQIIKEKVNSALIAGDFFHSPRPKNHTILIAQTGLRRLAKAGIKVYIVAGNHDATDIRAEVPSSKLLNEPGSGIYSFDDPYECVEVNPGIFIHFIAHHAFIDQEETMDSIKLIDGAVNILASHGSCYDTNIGAILRTPNEPREVIIPEAIINMPWDYTLLGHIHERGWIGSKDGKSDTSNRKQFYNGSLLRRGFADKVSINGRGWTKWIINKDKSIDYKMFTIHEREQLDLEPIDVKGKKAREVEIEIIKQLEGIDKYMENKYTEITLENSPIVRQTIIGVNAITRLSLNLQRFNQYTHNYLTHNFKIVPDIEAIDMENVVSVDTLNNSDIVVVFKEWNKANDKLFDFDDNLKGEIKDTAKVNLEASRDELLTKD
ncbi:MAG TPA: DNA repair exonuclease [Clostridiales bacterium]|nr:DNA repair exonuclease [Clostridiales bacterium]